MIDLIQELTDCERIRSRIRQQSMIYQYRDKTIVAEFYKIPFEQVDLPFNEWMALRKRYEADSGKQL